jgi:hypothetical protein
MYGSCFLCDICLAGRVGMYVYTYMYILKTNYRKSLLPPKTDL